MDRELRITARGKATYRSRTLAAGIAAVLCLGLIFAASGGWLAASTAGRVIFVIVVLAAYLYVLTDGVIGSADSISRERREGTLGLLLLTRLTARDLLLAKLVVNGVPPLSCLLAVLPVPGLLLFLGGVTVGEFARCSLALLNALFFAIAMCLFVSSIQRGGKRAFGRSLALVLGLGLAWPAVGILIHRFWPTGEVHWIFVAPGPAGALLAGLELPLRASWGGIFGASLVCTQAIGWSALAWGARHLTRDAGFDAVRRTPRFGTTTSARDPSPARRGRRVSQAWLDRNPIVWLADYQHSGRSGLWVFVIAGILTFAIFASLMGGWLFVGGPVFMSVLVLHLVLLLRTPALAASAFLEDRRSGALELLLTTPLSDEEIVDGRMLGLKRALLRPVAAVLTADLICLVGGWLELGWPGGALWTLGMLALWLWTLAEMYVLAWVGLWRGLIDAGVGRATQKTVFAVLLSPWLALLGWLVLWGIVTGGGSFADEGLVAMVFWGLVLALVCKTGFAGLAITNVRDNFRALAIAGPRESHSFKPGRVSRGNLSVGVAAKWTASRSALSGKSGPLR
jgi:ABC-type transport system involved in multi-copper enzyme maturation permease subunit